MPWEVMAIDPTCKKVSGFLQLKTETAQVNYKGMTVDTAMNVVRDEINERIDSSIFSIS